MSERREPGVVTLAEQQLAQRDKAIANRDGVIITLRATLATTQAALKDARAEIAAAERRGMEKACDLLSVARQHLLERSDRDERITAIALGVHEAKRTIRAHLARTALPPPSDAAPADEKEPRP